MCKKEYLTIDLIEFCGEYRIVAKNAYHEIPETARRLAQKKINLKPWVDQMIKEYEYKKNKSKGD